MSPPWAPHPALSGATYSAAELSHDDARVYLLDQRRLPREECYVALDTCEGVAQAIRDMVVRGAPAIGIAAAYGVVLALGAVGPGPSERARAALGEARRVLSSARPTAVNLAWAVERMVAVAAPRIDEGLRGPELAHAVAVHARRIHVDDVAACREMGRLGAELMPAEGFVLTHCNAGALATGGYGTALGVVRGAIAAGKRIRVLADETRPYLQGARLTAWELARDGIAVEVITDSMAAHFMRAGDVRAAVVGADRIARNGDVANKIGTYGLACLARAHDVPFYVAAPLSTIDLATASGAEIIIEERSRDEVARCGGEIVVPDGVGVRHPAFDVTPASLVTRIITEAGVVPPGALETLPGLARA